jgi:hypothetical protein
MISLDRLVQSLLSMTLMNIAAADAAPATSWAPQSNDAAPASQPAVLADNARAPSEALLGLRPPLVDARSALAALLNMPGFAGLLDVTGPNAIVSQRAALPSDPAGRGVPGQDGPVDDSGPDMRSAGERAAVLARVTDARASAMSPVAGMGDRAGLFDGSKPALASRLETGLAAASTAADRVAGSAVHAAFGTAGEAADVSAGAKAAADSVATALAGALAGPGSIERSGIIASFILNAAMVPGWPKPHQAGGLDVAGPQRDPSISDEEALKYLANLGASEAVREELGKMLRKGPPGRKILLGLAALLTALTVVIDTIRDELMAAQERQEDEENRNGTDHYGGRRRLYLP